MDPIFRLDIDQPDNDNSLSDLTNIHEKDENSIGQLKKNFKSGKQIVNFI